MLKAKMILAIYRLLPDLIKTNSTMTTWLQRIAEKEIVNLQKKLIQNHWRVYELKNKLR